ncbi:phage holin family protein [Microbacterium sp. cf332]|uniref:phage holin family protein n=1 Tax=Microbacterium sp. cf332 TaxID=1761804 RepID=UPI00087F84CB|nr:phage holin family protein [Microbacterium sp. cf332]SDQ47130.1 Putative Holin-X, holin superfamily III [Microbacterium sp. cf332]
MTDNPTPSEQQAATTSLGDLLGEVTRDLSELMRQEINLAKAELKESGSRAGKGAGMLGGAGYAALMAVFFLSVALWWAIGQLVGLGWSAVIVAVIWGIVAAVLFVAGRGQLKKVQGAPKTAETLGRIPDALKRNEENR